MSKRPSLEDKLVKYLLDQYPSWSSKGDLTRTQWRDERGVAYLPETVGRALRSAEESCRIAVKYEGKNTRYKWIPHEMRSKYIPTSAREGEAMFRK